MSCSVQSVSAGCPCRLVERFLQFQIIWSQTRTVRRVCRIRTVGGYAVGGGQGRLSSVANVCIGGRTYPRSTAPRSSPHVERSSSGSNWTVSGTRLRCIRDTLRTFCIAPRVATAAPGQPPRRPAIRLSPHSRYISGAWASMRSRSRNIEAIGSVGLEYFPRGQATTHMLRRTPRSTRGPPIGARLPAPEVPARS